MTRRFKKTGLVAVLVAMALLIALPAGAWFGDLPPPPEDEEPPVAETFTFVEADGVLTYTLPGTSDGVEVEINGRNGHSNHGTAVSATMRSLLGHGGGGYGQFVRHVAQSDVGR